MAGIESIGILQRNCSHMHLPLLYGVAVQQRADRPRPRRGRKKVVEETRALMLMRMLMLVLALLP